MGRGVGVTHTLPLPWDFVVEICRCHADSAPTRGRMSGEEIAWFMPLFKRKKHWPKKCSRKNFEPSGASRRPRFHVPAGTAALRLLGALVELFIQIVSRADQGKMRECLRKVPKLFPVGSQLLRVKTHVVRIAQSFLKIQSGLFHIARAGKTFDIPERTHGKSSLMTAKSSGGSPQYIVAIYQGIFHELFVDYFERRAPARVLGADELY